MWSRLRNRLNPADIHIADKMCAFVLDHVMNGRQLIAKVCKWARERSFQVRFDATAGPDSHGTLHLGDRKTTAKDRKKEIGKGLLNKMPEDLGIDRKEF